MSASRHVHAENHMRCRYLKIKRLQKSCNFIRLPVFVNVKHLKILKSHLWLVEKFLVVNHCLTVTAVEMKNLSNKHSFHLNKPWYFRYCNYERPFCNIFIDSYIEKNRMNDQAAWHRQQGQKSQHSQVQMGFPYLGMLLFYHWWKHFYSANHQKLPASQFSL